MHNIIDNTTSTQSKGTTLIALAIKHHCVTTYNNKYTMFGKNMASSGGGNGAPVCIPDGGSILSYLVPLAGLALAAVYFRSTKESLAKKQTLFENEQAEFKKAQKELEDKQRAIEEREKRLEVKEEEAKEEEARELLAKEEAPEPEKEQEALAAEESPEDIAAQKKAERQRRKMMIEDELRKIVLETEENELGEEMESEALRALRKASMDICYLKKYYDVFKDDFIYFPSVAATFMNYSMIEEAEKYYYDEDDEFPMNYSAALRSVAAMAAVDNDENADLDEDYMEKLAMDVDLGEDLGDEQEVSDVKEPSEDEAKDAESKMRKMMIEEELEKIITQTQENELEEPFEPEALLALRKAAMEIAYLKKYYDVMKDKLIYFPSVTMTLVNYSLIEEAEKYYFDEEDEFPMEYSAALRSVAMMADDEDDVDEEYMEKLAMDVAV
jgi:uncharacterized membrane protein YobD (UPF0266 family)